MAIISQFEGEHFSFSHSCDVSPMDSHFPMHIHHNHELFCLVKGNVGYVVEGRKYKMYPGTVLLMRSSESHKLIVNECQEYERYVINFSSEFFTSYGYDISILSPYFNRELGHKNRYLSDSFPISPLDFLKKIEAEAQIISPKDAVISNLSALLSSINVAFLSKSNRENDDGGIIAYINDNLTNDISVSQVARAVHLSPSQLSRRFKDLTGTSVHEYILTKRLILFHEKRRQGISTQRACIECGFHDYSSFYRLYKKRFGISPAHS